MPLFLPLRQTVEILARGLPLRLSAEAGAEPIQVLAQASQQRPRGPRRHARSVRDSACQYKRITSSEPDKVVLAELLGKRDNDALRPADVG
jgi:hypothetical protein